MSDRLKTAIIILVSAVWAANFTASIALPNYEPDASIHAVFMATVGGLFALGSKRDHGEDDR